jgi:DNA-directed RNA polymerase specialized sigma24 family protein
LFRRYWREAWRAAYAITGGRALAEDVAADGLESGEHASLTRRVCREVR